MQSVTGYTSSWNFSAGPPRSRASNDVTAEFDPLRDEGEAYAERLKEAGVPVTAKRYDGLIHGFFGMGLVLDAAKTAVPEVAGHLRAGLG